MVVASILKRKYDFKNLTLGNHNLNKLTKPKKKFKLVLNRSSFSPSLSTLQNFLFFLFLFTLLLQFYSNKLIIYHNL